MDSFSLTATVFGTRGLVGAELQAKKVVLQALQETMVTVGMQLSIKEGNLKQGAIKVHVESPALQNAAASLIELFMWAGWGSDETITRASVQSQDLLTTAQKAQERAARKNLEEASSFAEVASGILRTWTSVFDTKTAWSYVHVFFCHIHKYRVSVGPLEAWSQQCQERYNNMALRLAHRNCMKGSASKWKKQLLSRLLTEQIILLKHNLIKHFGSKAREYSQPAQLLLEEAMETECLG